MSDKAILEDRKVKLVDDDDDLDWAKWFETADRHVAQDEANGVRVSTVFLGMNHGFPGGPDLWFETMIFGGPHDGFQERYETWDEAELGHRRALALAFAPQGEK